MKGHVEMNSIEKEIELYKSRMNEIAETRPGNLNLTKEYLATQARLKDLELKLLQDTNGQFARPLHYSDARWDLRTESVKMFFDLSAISRGWIFFKHAESVRKELCLMYCFRFTDVLDVKTSREDFTETMQYVNEIVGLDNLGLFEVINSKWCELKNLASDTNYQHYCLVYANVVIEILATQIEGKPFKIEREDELVKAFVEGSTFSFK